MSQSERFVALRLYLMSDDDRQWILNQLDDRSVTRIRERLDDIRKIVPEHMASLVSDILLTNAPGNVRKMADLKATNPAFVQAVEYIDGMDPGVVHAALQRVPSAMAAAFFHAFAWSWRPAVVSRCSKSLRQSLTNTMGNIANPGVTNALVLAMWRSFNGTNVDRQFDGLTPQKKKRGWTALWA